MLRRLLPILAVLVGIMALGASPAQAGRYGYTIPGGLPTSSPQAAANVAFDFAEQNSQYAGLIQREAGASGEFNRKDYEAVKFSDNASGTMTTATDQTNGSIVAMKGDEKVKVVVVKNIKTSVSVKLMIKCGQVRVKFMRPIRTQRITRSRKVRVNRVVKVDKVVCPSGVALPVSVKVTVKGWVKVKGKITVKSVAAQVTAYVNAKVDLKIRVEVTAKCPPPVIPPLSCEELKNCPSPPAIVVSCKVGETLNSQGICVAIAVVCEVGKVLNSAGVCVTQTNTAEQACKAQGGTFNGDTSLCTIIQINGNCSNIIVISGSGNTVDNWQEGNCNVNPPPAIPPTTPPVVENRPPVVSIYNPPKHVCSGTTVSGQMMTSGYVILTIMASDPDGDNLGNPQVTAVRGTVSKPTKIADGQWTVKYTAPTTVGKDTVTATVSDGKAPIVQASTPQFDNPVVDLDNPSPTTC